ncbi:MAG: hypothetical protein ACLFVQ_00420 [Chitinispirillaceae bacterium]
MNSWNLQSLKEVLHNPEELNAAQSETLLHLMNRHFPPQRFEKQLEQRRRALKHAAQSKHLLEGTHQHFPDFLSHSQLDPSPLSLKGWGIVFTAGGEGERLRLSLLSQGVPADELKEFTKATYPLKGFFKNYGTLHTNLAMTSWMCRETGFDIPVIITTGPQGSITHRVIPRILEENSNFGLKNIRLVAQDERLHFTLEEKIVCQITDDTPCPVTQPDETGGPLMKLKQISDTDSISALDWLSELGCEKILAVQATALYDRDMLPLMARAAQNSDCLGVGILRTSFEPKDPFGTFVSLERDGSTFTSIIEQDIRNDATRSVKDPSGRFHLPFNTGFYAFDCNILRKHDLPDYATPPKQILPDLPRSPKVGYAATDILPLGSSPIILTVDPQMYGVIKTADDLEKLTQAGIQYGLKEICAKVEQDLPKR